MNFSRYLNLRSNHSTVLFAVILAFYLLVAWQSTGFHNADEHFQIIEFANYKLGKATLGDLAWEYNAQVRSGIQPALCYVIFKLANLIGITDVFHLAFLLRAITALFAVIVIRRFILSSIGQIDTKNIPIYVLLSYFLWFLPFINVRFSSEAWSGLLFLLAISIIQKEKPSTRHYLLFGMVAGLAVLFRYQTALLVLGAFLWLWIVARARRSNLGLVILSGMLALFIGFIIDYWLYGQFTVTLYRYFYVNIVQDVASQYGVAPWYEIFIYISKGPGPWGIFILFAFLFLAYRQPKNLILWVSAPFLLVHMIVPHKELRFLFPIANFAPLILILAYQNMKQVQQQLSRYYLLSYSIFFILLIANLAGLLVIATKSAGNTKLSVVQYIHQHYSGEKMNIIYIEGANPYADVPFPKNTFYNYNSKETSLTSIITIWQPDYLKSKQKEGYKNLLVITNNEITGPRTVAYLEKLHLKKLHQSISWLDQQILRFYNDSYNNDNLILYAFEN